MTTRMFVSGHAFKARKFLMVLGVVIALVGLAIPSSRAGFFDSWFSGHTDAPGPNGRSAPGCVADHQWTGAPVGTWYWVRSPEEERRTIIGLYNRYCIRCHGVDGRGIWDIPGVPDFTNLRFQASRSDGQFVRSILEGRGAVMPPFRGTLTLEEAWGMSRYLRTFIPGSGKSRPHTSSAKDKDKEDKDDKEKDKGKELPLPRENNGKTETNRKP